MSSELLLSQAQKDAAIEDDASDGISNYSRDTACRDFEKARYARSVCRGNFMRNFHVTLALVNCFLFTVLVLRNVMATHDRALRIQSPADEAIRYKTTYFDKYGHLGGNPFSQPPGPELDKAWHRLLAGMNIAVSNEWLDPFGAETIPLADNSGMLVQLGIYHELHCLKKLKRWNYRSHYYGNLSDADLNEEEIHVEHCLEWLRVAALCRSDTTLTTFQWEGANGSRLATEYPIPRMCVDSEQVMQWSEERAVDITQEGILEHS
ncbi:hypothetical protein K458DRAFT_431144 [Lentithecium fluviatile CBS 122367]|uniref:Tat pathway signal sequence n=1 Tax=Lentithecium fluviatile CBS 122367 TaxID=1168545 RepID=A0A6G1J3S6_9PLEO|nr:hypothetical protein K458DRAFT_431144 [Lentithecium fluviatile CBS 122367]